MKTITVHASRSYPVYIGTGLLKNIGNYLSNNKICTAAIISDSNVWPIYGDLVSASLENAGFDVIFYIFPAGEAQKNFETFASILNFLAENQLTRTDAVIALGGGVVGDMAGFAAATYLRGISYIQIPTSLLAMVDSSVGGKTAIDLPAGKNLAGAFYQPSMVICDVDALLTLPEEVFRDGCAEVIKYGVLYDQKLFSHLREKKHDFDKEYVISRCIELKRDVVIQDEFDTGVRQMLNLGHTVGHAIEAQSNFAISHGQAVAIGMCIIAKAAQKHNLCSEITFQQIFAVIRDFGLPTDCSFTAQQLTHNMLSDKKRTGKTINLIIPKNIGCCQIQSTPIPQLQSFIEAGL